MDEKNKTGLEPYYGLVIKDITLDKEDDKLYITFDNDIKIMIFDDGQACCEHRYMETDDTLSDVIGATLIDSKIKEADEDGEWDYILEIRFFEIITSKGSVVIKNYNEHNGYYGGFCIVIIEMRKD